MDPRLALADMERALRKTVVREVDEQVPTTRRVFLVPELKEFNEAAHPRDDRGRFSSGGGAATVEVTENHNSTRGEYLFAGHSDNVLPTDNNGPQLLTHHVASARALGDRVHAVTAQINNPAEGRHVEYAQEKLGLTDQQIAEQTGRDPQEHGPIVAALHPAVAAELQQQGYDGAVGHMTLNDATQPVHVVFSGSQVQPAAGPYTSAVAKDGAPVDVGTRYASVRPGVVAEVTNHLDPDSKGRAQVEVTYHHPTDPDKTTTGTVVRADQIGDDKHPRLADYDERYYVSAEGLHGEDFGTGSEHPAYSSAVAEARGLVQNEGAGRAYVWPATHQSNSAPSWGQNRIADSRGDMVHQVNHPDVDKMSIEWQLRRKLWEAARDADLNAAVDAPASLVEDDAQGVDAPGHSAADAPPPDPSPPDSETSGSAPE